MITKSMFLTELKTQNIDDNNSFLLEDLVYQSELLQDTIRVPRGFISDGSSTPRVPLIFWLYGNRSHREGFLHDFLYRTHLVTKKIADNIFFEAMESRGKPFYIKWGMYLGVKFGGFSSYKTGSERFKVLNEEEILSKNSK